MSDPQEPYSIVPPTPESPPSPPPSSATPASAEPRAKSADLKAKLNVAGLLEGFEEDADFDKDPELEAKITGKPRPSPGAAAPGPPPPEFVQPGFGQPKHWAIVGAVLTVGAVAFAGVNAPNHTFPRILLTLYSTFINTGTGLVALYGAARLLESRFGNLELAAARMFTAVSVFMLLMNLKLTPFGANLNGLNRALTMLVAMAGYVLAVATTFRLWDRQKLGFVVGFHALLWMLVQVGIELASVVGAAPTAKPG